MMLRRVGQTTLFALTLAAGMFAAPSAAAQEIVLYSSDVTSLQGWVDAAASDAAGGRMLATPDNGWSTTSSPLAYPSYYIQTTFEASANTPYHVWLRMRGTANSKYNESVWVQFDDATDLNGSPIYRLSSTSALLINLENCGGCGIAGWGWQDKAWWLYQTNTIKFAASGTHTIRIQTREDGVQIDQIVLSPSAYLTQAPGYVTYDTTIVPKSGAVTAPPSGDGASTSGTGPYTGTPVQIPGIVYAANFDKGGEGTAYHDSTSGNTGGAYRTDESVDLQPSAGGGYNVGWIAAGEWLNYTVNVGSAGSYTAQLRVASPYGGSLQLGFNGPSNVWTTASIPATGGWQNWTTVPVPVALGAGQQQITLSFAAGGLNVASIDVVSGSPTPTTVAPPPPPPPSSGGSFADAVVVDWNISVNDSSAWHAQSVITALLGLSPRPQIIVLQEAYSFHFNTYINQLAALTGQSWQGVFQTHCPSGAWNGSYCSWSEDEGVAIFSSFPVLNSSVGHLPYADCYHSARAAARLAVSVGGTTLQVFGTHLQTGGCTNVVAARSASMSVLKSWASNFTLPQIVAGDLNAGPDEINTWQGMLPFVDAWTRVGSGDGYTAFGTNPTMRIDYWLADGGGKAQPQWTVVPTSTGTISDHLPVHTGFRIFP